MKKKYQVKIGKQSLSEEQIKSHRDFDRVYESYKGQSRSIAGYSRLKWITVAASLIILAGIYLYQNLDTEKSYRFITQPLEKVNVEFSSYTVDVSKGAALDYWTGSTIMIPPDAFIDKQGNVITGTVDINYREFHDPLAFFASGIPMTYEMEDETYHFESAGMVEITAFYSGEMVFVNPERKIELKMASTQLGRDYNVFFLDTLSEKWVDKGKDSTQPIKVNVVRSEQTSDDTVITVIPPKPMKPELAKEERFRFEIDVNPEEFPEIMAYKDVTFEVIKGEDQDLNIGDIIWEDVRIKKEGEYYKIYLRKDTQVKVIRVNPVLSEEDYEKAIQVYEEKFAEYEALLAKKKADEIVRKARQEREYREQFAAKKLEADLVFKATRSFKIDGFGIWNCDRPTAYPSGQNMMASFHENGHPVKQKRLYLVDESKNAIFSYYTGNGTIKNFQYDPTSNNLIWVVLGPNRLGIYSPDKIKEIYRGVEQYSFNLAVIEGEFATAEDIGKVLNFN